MVSDSDDDRFALGTTFLTDQDQLLTVAGARMGNHGRIIRFDEISDRNGAEALRGRVLTIAAQQRRQLDTGEYWPDELVGLDVVSTSGMHVGTVTDVVLGGAQDRLVIGTVASSTVEVPFVDELVPEVDLEGGVIVIRPVDGLLSEAE